MTVHALDIEEMEAWAALCSIPHLGPVKLRALIETCGSAIQAFEAAPEILKTLPGFGEKGIQAWNETLKKKAWQLDFEKALEAGIEFISYRNPAFPKLLKDIPDAPVLLYAKGDIETLKRPALGIVGTRQASIYGMEMTEAISKELAESGFVIVSGLARGIDTAAHHGALASGRTIAVLGSGLGDIYPRENQELARKIAMNGGVLLTEFPYTTPPDRQHFPQRNRIVSGMSQGILLTEAPLISGAMLTMERGLKYQRKLWALPGRVDVDSFQGNHSLIKKGQARLIENAHDILQTFETLWTEQPTSRPAVLKQKNLLDPEEEKLLNFLPKTEVSFDEIVKISQWPVTKLNFLLMSLILKKEIKEFPGKMYRKFNPNG